MIKLIATDLDNTLAPVNGPANEFVREKLKEFENRGIEIVLISGKPVGYLAGFARQFGLKNPILIGENGCVVSYSHCFPPARFEKAFLDPNQIQLLGKLKKIITTTYKDLVWIQPNEVQLTCFWSEGNERVKYDLGLLVDDFFREEFADKLFTRYCHFDSIEILPKDISKGLTLTKYLSERSIEVDEILVLGDSTNDISMFSITPNSIGIRTNSEITTRWRFDTIDEAILWAEQNLI